MTHLARRLWAAPEFEDRWLQIAERTSAAASAEVEETLMALTRENRRIHDEECFNLNPATNVMNPVAERLLAEGLGSRPSLGRYGEKYEFGLEAIEEIEVIAAALAAEVFSAAYAEIRVGPARWPISTVSWPWPNRATRSSRRRRRSAAM